MLYNVISSRRERERESDSDERERERPKFIATTVFLYKVNQYNFLLTTTTTISLFSHTLLKIPKKL